MPDEPADTPPPDDPIISTGTDGKQNDDPPENPPDEVNTEH
jgi:hypothetical protein